MERHRRLKLLPCSPAQITARVQFGMHYDVGLVAADLAAATAQRWWRRRFLNKMTFQEEVEWRRQTWRRRIFAQNRHTMRRLRDPGPARDYYLRQLAFMQGIMTDMLK